MYDSDDPINKSEQDRLGRSGFAKSLARCLLDHNNPESFVIGLHGGWGCGKTSIINLTLEELHIASNNMLDEEKPIILNFSPWNYSGQQQLIHYFFRRLSSEIYRSPFVENSEKIIELLELYVSFFTHLPVPTIFQPKHNMVEKFTNLNTSPEEAYGWESGHDLTQIKVELNELLTKQKHKIIIFIDDIARIEDTEIKQLFQIVKSMGNYANTIYILAIDKERIVNAINHIYGTDGAEYLAKIVQLPFEIPEISQQNLANILLDRLYQLVKTIPESMWDSDYWADLYYSTLKQFFRNCRDITHYINTLSFSFSRVKELVNPVDFFAMTALSVFEPAVYTGIRDNKDLFTDFISNVFELDHEKIIEDKLRCDEIIARCEHSNPDNLIQLLIRLFPKLRMLYEINVPFYHSEDLARRHRRICSADVFDIYFKLSLPSGSISTAEMNALLLLTCDETAFSQAILRLNKDERINHFLEQFDSHAVKKIDLSSIPVVVNVLVNSTDLFPEIENNPLIFNNQMHVHRILRQLLRSIYSNKQRFIVFREALKKSTLSLYFSIYELQLQSKETLENEDTFIPQGQRDFTLSQLEILKKIAVSKIRYWAEIGRLAEHPKLLDILYAWKEWGDAEECRRFVAKMVQEDKGLLAFLSSALKFPIDQAITKLEKNLEWEYSLRHIDNFISTGVLALHVKMIFEDPSFEQLREREQLAVLIFLDLIKAITIKIIPKTSA